MIFFSYFIEHFACSSFFGSLTSQWGKNAIGRATSGFLFRLLTVGIYSGAIFSSRNNNKSSQHTLSETVEKAREEINELTNTRAKVTRQNVYKKPLNSSLQQSRAQAAEFFSLYTRSLHNRRVISRKTSNNNKPFRGATLSDGRRGRASLSIIEIHMVWGYDDKRQVRWVSGSEWSFAITSRRHRTSRASTFLTQIPIHSSKQHFKASCSVCLSKRRGGVSAINSKPIKQRARSCFVSMNGSDPVGKVGTPRGEWSKASWNCFLIHRRRRTAERAQAVKKLSLCH